LAKKGTETTPAHKRNAERKFQLEREICFIMKLLGGKIIILTAQGIVLVYIKSIIESKQEVLNDTIY
jgi:hypothetical protein